MRRVILDTDDISASLTFETGFPMLHMEVHGKMTISMYKYIKNIFMEDLLVTLGVLGYDTLFAVLEESDEVGIKSAKVVGFEEERTVDGTFG